MKEIEYFKNFDENGYLSGLSTTAGQDKIKKEEYDKLWELVRNRPKAEEGFAYGLKTDLTWEKYEKPIVKEEGEEQ